MKKAAFIAFLVFCGLCHAERILFDVAGYGEEADTIVPVAVEWNDSWFEPFSAPQYNHALARAAGVLCSVSYDSQAKDGGDIISKAYSKLGVAQNDIEWHYDIDYDDSEWGMDQAAFSLAKKRLASGGDLIFVVIRGTPGNKEEWLSNINIWNSFLQKKKSQEGAYHEGFYKAVLKVKDALANYADKKNLDLKKSSLLITGHSRGAALSNLLSALLADEELILTDRTFTYAFATPNVTTRTDARDSKYNFIYNIVNGEDIVPTVPPYEKKWRFTKFGQTMAIVNSWNCDDLEEYENEFLPKMNALYTRLLGRKYHPFNTGTFIPSKIGDSLAFVNPTTKSFYKGIFPLHKKLEKTITSEFPSTRENDEKSADEEKSDEEKKSARKKKRDDSVAGIRKFFESIKKRADTKTQVLINYSLNAFVDMHAMQSYLSWLMALDEIDLYSSRESSIVRIKGNFNGAVVDENGNVYAKIYDGVLRLRETKAPLAAWQIPIGNFGAISLGFPYSENFSLLVYKDSIVPTPIKVVVERYASDGTFMGEISKKCAGAHMGMVYDFSVGKDALSKVDGSPASYKKLKRLDAKRAIKDGKLKNTDVSHMSFETHIDTDRFWEFGMTGGLQKFYLSLLFGFDTKRPSSTQIFSMGVGTQHSFCGPVMLNAEAYARFAHYKPANSEDEWRFTLVPATRFMLSIKPAKRIQFFSALEMNFALKSLNNDLFKDGYREGGIRHWTINDGCSIEPSIQFGVRL